MNMNIYFSDFSFCLLVVTLMMLAMLKTSIVKRPKQYIVIFVFLLSVMAFFFDPIKAWINNGNYTDLYRFYLDMNAFRAHGWDGNNVYFRTAYYNVPLVKLLVYAVSWTNCYGLLAMIASLIAYGGLGQVLIDIQKTDHQSNQYAAIRFFIFVALINYKVVITNIRMPIGLTLFFIILYLDLVKKVPFYKCLLLYISLGAIHSIFLLFLLLRLILFVGKNYNKYWVYLIVLFSGSFVSLATRFLQRLGNSNYILNILGKIDFYTTGSKSEYYELPIIILGVVKILVTLYLLYKWKNKENGKYEELIRFTQIFSIFCAGTIWNYYLFARMTNFLPYLIVVLANQNVMQTSMNFKKMHYSELVILLLCSLHLAYYFLSYQYRVMCF